MMKILVTGGAGFIGSHVVDIYLANGYEVVVVDDFSSGQKKNLPTNIKIYEASISNVSMLDEIFKAEKPDIVNHHAAQINVRASIANPQKDAEANIIGGLNLLEVSKKYNVKKIIFASTGGAIYGDTDLIPTEENHTEKPISPYGIAKLSFEKYLYYYKEIFGLSYTVLRYANVYGPRQNAEGEAGVVSIFINKLLSNQQPFINGDGLQTRDFVFVEDVANANLLALKANSSDIYNVGTGLETNINDLFDLITKNFPEKIIKKYNPEIPGEQKRSCLSYAKIKKALNWQPKFELVGGINKTVEYFKKQK